MLHQNVSDSTAKLLGPFVAVDSNPQLHFSRLADTRTFGSPNPTLSNGPSARLAFPLFAVPSGKERKSQSCTNKSATSFAT
jgi:hypothetical protein